LRFAGSALVRDTEPVVKHVPLAVVRGDCFLERDLSPTEQTRFRGDSLQYGGGFVFVAKNGKTLSAWRVTDAQTQIMLSYAYNLACPLRGP
jgi:hypothetical protein